MLWSLTAVCVTAIAGVSIWLSMRTPAPAISLVEVTVQALTAKPVAMNEISEFRNSVALVKPATMDTRFLDSAARQLGEGGVAVYFFTIRSRSKSYEGRLIVVPVASLKDPPTATSFLAGTIDYRPPYHTTAWVEGKLAYVCCVRDGGESTLHWLQRRSV